MESRTAGWGIVLVLALGATCAHALSLVPSPPEPTDEQREAGKRYRQAQLDFYDALSHAPSPRVQVLAGSLSIDEDDAANALRPKRADVVARAATLAPDDAFVQWTAAADGSYYSSQCGPTQWPEAEVANLVRLEPDNAGALLYAVALAQAKGDEDGLDSALARMASAPRASDHSGEEIGLWRELYATVPAVREADMFPLAGDDAAPTPSAALRFALQRRNFRHSSATSSVESACTPDPRSERAWRRLGWCADAGRLLADKGDSFALRELGLKLLVAVGDDGHDVLKRRFDWLSENAANPFRNGSAFEDAPADLAADWHDAPNEIVATERRLERLGKPAAPPAEWAAPTDEPDADQGETWRSYLRTVVEDLRGSGDVRERAIGLAVDMRAVEERNEETEPQPAGIDTTLADLAAANPDDRFVQWIAALAGNAGEHNESAVARVRQLEPDNAAAWTLTLDTATETAEMLRHAASATRYDEHAGAPILLLHAAFRRHPMSAELGESADDGIERHNPGSITAFVGAMSIVAANLSVAPSANVLRTCKSDAAKADAAVRADCVTLARLMLNSDSSLMAVMVGESTLRALDAFDAADAGRARQLAWWRSQSNSTIEDFERYVDDFVASGNEIEALRRMRARAGKENPPADWVSTAEKQAEKAKP